MTVALLGALLLVTACSSQTDTPAASPSPSPTVASPSPSPSPTPPPVTPVTGNVEVDTIDASRPAQLGFADDGPPPEGSVEAVTEALAAALDAHLDAAQRGTAELDTLGAAWLQEEAPEGAELLLTGLTDPSNPVERATYDLLVQLEPGPTVASGVVYVARRDGTLRQVDVAFDVTGDQPVLTLLGTPEAS